MGSLLVMYVLMFFVGVEERAEVCGLVTPYLLAVFLWDLVKT